ncbi:MAG: FtsK/SpoIIIE domain-containing protein [Ilumatobacteraceae bacterium]
MDVVLRTPNGEAEVSLGPGQEDALLTDVVERVTGRPASQVVYIDGRAVPSATSIGTSGLLNGSTIATMDDAQQPPSDGRVEIVQIAGHGAGARSWLSAGRYRIGVGRRVSAQELDAAPVDTPMLEIEVDSDGSVGVRAASAQVRLDGVVLGTESATPWTTGLVDVAGRVFALGRRDPRAGVSAGHRFGGVGVDGTAAFNRPPRLAPAPDLPPLEVPDGGAQVRAARRFPLLTMLAPIPIAIAMALLLGSPTFLLFGLMSPAMGGANWLTERRSRRRDVDESTRADRDAIASFTSAARDRHDQVRDRRRAAHPDLADVVLLGESASPELWQRRPGHVDVFQVAIGLADLDWSPELARTQQALSSAQAIVNDLGPTPMVPVTVDLLTERGVAFVGGSDFGRAAVRGVLLEAAVAHGPADLDVVVLSSGDRVHAWEWVKWLPHARSGGGVRVYSTEDQVTGWAAAVRRGWERPARPVSPNHLTLVIVDEPTWWRERTAPLRPLFSDASMPLRFVALTDESADVPAVCTTLVTAQPDHGATVDYLMDRRHVDAVHLYSASESLALRVARRLAPLDDPDVPMASESTLPESVPVLGLLGLLDPVPDDLVARWSRRVGHRAVVTVGMSDRGPLELDLVGDGPHALIAGTTGAGKSELLRSLVVGLAAELPPDDINFVLVDFKGGSAFDACANLPHTVGLVTDLDEHLAGRVLRCLRAELQHRELVLRAAGSSSLVEYQQLDGVPPLPRLVLVVDEFASVVAELPEFLPSLVDIAQRGRSLGLHMILATQRPAGVVDNKIRANTNLRIALRVQDDGDSLDVIGTKDAAQLPRRIPGRAYARLGAGELTMFQSAYSTGVSIDDQAAPPAGAAHHHLDVSPYVVARELAPMESRLVRRSLEDDDTVAGSPTDLVRLVGAIAGAALEVGQSEQRQPYPDPLTEHLPFERFLADHPGDAVPFALVDLPDEQRQSPAWWSPDADGSLLVYGIAGAGTSSLLVSLVLGLAERSSADDVHVYCIDADSNVLAPLAALPHVGAVVRLDELDRVARLATHLSDVLDHRKQLALEQGGPAAVASSEPAVVLMIDNVGSLRQQLEERRDLDGVWGALERVIRDGRSLGLCAVITAKQERAVPSSLSAQIPGRLVMRLGEQFGYSAFGFKTSEIPEFVPGRAVRPDDKSEMQLVEPPAALASVVAAMDCEPAGDRPVRRIDPLPSSVSVSEVVDAASRRDRAIVVPVGLDTRTATPACCVVPFGENVMVSGAPGSGRSSVLAAFAAAASRVEPRLETYSVTPRGGPLADIEGTDHPATPSDVAAWVDRIAEATTPRLVLVDDADRLGGPSFERLAALRDDELIVVVAGRGDDLRAPGHWSKPLQRFRHGVLLRPESSDGDLVRVALGARLQRFAPHRGVLVVDGEQIPLLAAIADATTPIASSSEGIG